MGKSYFHMNPSFSRDGKRVYYNKPMDDTRSGTFYFDLTALEDGKAVETIVATQAKEPDTGGKTSTPQKSEADEDE